MLPPVWRKITIDDIGGVKYLSSESNTSIKFDRQTDLDRPKINFNDLKKD